MFDDLTRIISVDQKGNKRKKKKPESGKGMGHDQRSWERARIEWSIECLRWSIFLDGRSSDAKLINRLKNGFFIPLPPLLLAPE